jgi:chromosome segregation ATPase
LTIAQGQLSSVRASFNSASEEKAVMQESLVAAKDEIQRLRSIEQAAAIERQRAQQLCQQNEELTLTKIKLETQLSRAIEESGQLSAELKEAARLTRAAEDRAVSDAAAVGVMRQREEKAVGELVNVRRQVIAAQECCPIRCDICAVGSHGGR